MKKSFVLFIIVFMILSVDAKPSFAGKDVLPLISESQYFSLHGAKDISIPEILKKIPVNYFLRYENLVNSRARDPREMLSQTIDAMYLEISDVLGIKLPDFKGAIHFYPDKKSLQAKFKSIYKTGFNEAAFYVFDYDTIYISVEDLRLGILGHEIAHAIITKYFVVPPPPKIQEVLSGYVEFKLRQIE